MTPSPLLLLAGPTASGKTALAVELAERLDGEIISADSMQIYRGCAIGTAQPSPGELRGVPCHLVGTIEPDAAWSVADWLRAARALIDAIRARGRTPIVAGGTGLYFKALTAGLFETDGAARDPVLRARLEGEWEADGGAGLRERLASADPESAARIHPNDRLRVVRALEVLEATGRPLSEWQACGRAARPPLAAWRFVLCASREDLYRRIDARVADMVAKGFAGEVRTLLERGATSDWPALRALGYPQMARHVGGGLTLEAAVAETCTLSRRYAKQQTVLLRQWPAALWLDADRGLTRIADAVQKVLEFSTPPVV